MASMPPTGGISPGASAGLSFVANIGFSFVMSRFAGQDGPRLQNKEAAGGDYGVPMPRAYGTSVRLTGAFIAQADIKEKKHKISSKELAVIGGAIGGAASGFQIGGPVGAGIGAVAGGLLGFASPNHYYYTYSDTFAPFLLDRTNDFPIDLVAGVKIYANGKLVFSESPTKIGSQFYGTDGKLIWRQYKKNKYFKSLRVYTGHTEQDVDPVLEDDVDEDGGYPFSAYAVFEDFQLEAFGNSLPTFEFIIGVKTGESMASAAEAIASAANIDPIRNLSTTALADSSLRGYLISSETSCWDAIKPLLPVFAVDAAEVYGQIRFYRRSQTMRATIPVGDMGAHIYGDSPPEKYLFKRETDLNLPREVAFTFVDVARNHQSNTASSARSEGSAASNITANVAITLTASEGASAAALMLWDAWLGRTALSFSLTDGWIGLATGLAYGVTVADQVVPYRITRRLRGANGIIEVEALSDESVTYTANVAGSEGTVPPDENTEFAQTRLILMDMAIQADDHDDYGFYIAMGGSDADWPRGAIQASSDGINFVTILDQPFGAIMGDVTGTLAAGTTDGLDDTLDTTTVLTVVLLHDGMELESATDGELDAWANFCFVGKDGLGEYLQFKTATHVSGSTWQLTNLRRGRRGTDFAIATHASGEEFCLLGEGGVYRIVYSDTSSWGDTITFRGLTLHQDEDDPDLVEQTFINTGEGKRPFSPVNVAGTWDGSYNLTATFDARSRLFAGGLGIDDNFEFDVEITNATPVRSFTVTTESFDYDAADAVSDGLVAGQVVEGRIRQTSDVNDGRWREFVLYGPLSLTADSDLITADTTLLTADAG